MWCLQGNNKQEEKHRQETHQFVKACKGQEDNFREQEKRPELLRRNDQAKHPKGETLPHDMRMCRFDLIQSFLTAGIPLSKIDCLRSFLEKYGHWLTLRVT